MREISRIASVYQSCNKSLDIDIGDDEMVGPPGRQWSILM